MSEYRRQIVTGAVVAAIIAIIAVAGAVYLPLSTTTTSPAGTSYITHNFPTTYSSSSSNGPQLQINMNASQIQYGGHLSVKIELFNPSSENESLNVNYSNNQTILDWNSKDFLCSLGPVQNLFGFALYQGDYTSQNISTAYNQLVLAPDAGIGCPTTYQPNISKVTIAPGSDAANFSNGNSQNLEINATTESCRTQGQGYECGGGVSLYGYWTSPPANESCNQLSPINQTAPHGMYYPPNCNLVSFPVGTYTLVSQDLWNHTVYAYFQVVNQSSSSSSVPFSISATVNSSIIQNYGSAITVTVIVLNNGSTTISIPPLYQIVQGATVLNSAGTSIGGTPTPPFTGQTSSAEQMVSLSAGSSLIAKLTIVFLSAQNPVAPNLPGGELGPTSINAYGTAYIKGNESYTIKVNAFYPDGQNANFIFPVNNGISSSSNSETTTSVACSISYSNYTIPSASLYLAPKSGSTANLCVRYFYYNTTATTINTLDQLTIYATVPSSGTLRNVNSSFSISASIPQFQIGGPQSTNEGILVVYTIRSIGSAPSATYEIGLSSGLYPQDVICGWGIYVSLQVGNTTNPTVGTSCHYVPAPQNNPGLVYSQIVGMTNSTG